MEMLLERAKSFASEAAKRSQDLAKEAAKISQEIALETAKRSKELAMEASKKADRLKALAGDITFSTSSAPSTTSSSSSSSSLPSEEELRKYGITPELREFVHGLTVNTFQDFPVDAFDSDGNAGAGPSNVCQDLTEWQEQHALLLLKAVPEISQFRYALCPRVMKEKRFWKIYFTLVRSHVVLYETPRAVPEDFLVSQPIERASGVPFSTTSIIELVEPSLKGPEVAETSNKECTKEMAAKKKRIVDDQDLDAYLLGDSDAESEGEDRGDGFDADFDQLVNSSALESDEEQAPKLSGSPPPKGNDASSDGELV